ncbi:Hypothetical_protein [Hexamita inflata]|uniref:Hypothetical_protein n=1 Tax=Hexamita inflata TaxID=28002 RepID=A0AA86QF40_9EUKA|nr:Hypothetical protein HINF_LOCUS45170 [Hexamita inflata]
MPLVFNFNDDNLDLIWSDCLPPSDVSELKDAYEHISITGTNMCSLQDQIEIYNLFTRAESVGITDCLVDLNKIKGEIKYLCINQCTCIGKFSKKAIIQQLTIQNSNIKVSQMIEQQIQSLNVSIEQDCTFDYKNCNQFQFQLKNLSIINQLIELNNWKGDWESLYLNKCEYIGNISKDSLSVNQLDICLNEHQNLRQFDNIIGEKAYIYATTQKPKQNFVLQNNNQFKTVSTYLENYGCNLSQTSGVQSNLQFTNCNLSGNPNEYNEKYEETHVKIIIEDKVVFHQDFGALHQLKSKLLILQIINQNMDFRRFINCNPQIILISGCEVNSDYLCGSWEIIKFHKCQFTNQNTLQQIKAKQIIIKQSNLQTHEPFKADYLTLIEEPQVNIFPNVEILTIQDTKINVSQQNTSTVNLILNNCQLIKFSASMLHKLQTIQLYGSHNHQASVINDYLKIKQNIKVRAKQVQNIHTNTHNIVINKKQFVNSINTQLQNIFAMILQQQFSNQ